MKKFLFLLIILSVFVFTGCGDAAYVASYNLSKDADNFKIYRRVVFYNGITDAYILSVEGFCSIEVDGIDEQLELTVRTGADSYYKHFLGISDNVTYFVEQLEPADVSEYYYKVRFRPSTIIPDIEVDLP